MKSVKPWQKPEESKLEKLPRWAQSYVDLLEKRLAEQEELVEKLSGEGVEYGDRDDSKLYVHREGDELYREVGERSRVIFPLGGGRTAEVRADRTGRGGIEIMTDGQVAVLPQVSNVVRIIGVGHNV